jgi:hypothetical protein
MSYFCTTHKSNRFLLLASHNSELLSCVHLQVTPGQPASKEIKGAPRTAGVRFALLATLWPTLWKTSDVLYHRRNVGGGGSAPSVFFQPTNSLFGYWIE